MTIRLFAQKPMPTGEPSGSAIVLRENLVLSRQEERQSPNPKVSLWAKVVKCHPFSHNECNAKMPGEGKFV